MSTAFDALKSMDRGPIGIMADASQGTPPPDDNFWYSPLGSAGYSSSGMMVSPETALTISTVMACIRVLSEGVGSLPLDIFERSPDRKGKMTAYDHNLYELLKYQPNEKQTAMQFWEMATAHCLLRGVFYAEIKFSKPTLIASLEPLNPDRMTLVKLPSGRIRYDYRDEEGTLTKYFDHQLFRIEGLSLDGVRPVSLIRYARETLGLAIAAQTYGSTFFKNNGRPNGVLSHPGKVQVDARERMKQSWQEAYGGVNNAGKVALLEEGVTYHQVSLNMQDAQFLETRKFQRSEICALYRVPPHKVMDLERSTNNNIEHQSIEFVQDSLRPWLVRIEQALRRDLILEPMRYLAEFNVDGLLRGDAKTRSMYFSKALGSGGGPAWMTQNEVRNKENLNPLPGGDELPQPINKQVETPSQQDANEDEETDANA